MNYRSDLQWPEEVHTHAGTAADPNDPIRLAFHQALARWDYQTEMSWTNDTEPNTPVRRNVIYDLLCLSSKQRKLIDESLPPSDVNTQRPPIDSNPSLNPPMPANRSMNVKSARAIMAFDFSMCSAKLSKHQGLLCVCPQEFPQDRSKIGPRSCPVDLDRIRRTAFQNP